MKLPDFIFIGPSKTGSTWIFELLRQHPQVFVPVAKDIYFFDKFYHKGMEWYSKHFQAAKDGQMIGELSHDYFSSREAMSRIREVLPEVKLICCLRDPFKRAESSYRYFLRNGYVFENFEDAINQYPEIYHEGLYYTHLSYILSQFNRKQVLILLFDDLNKDPAKFAASIFHFLGVSQSFSSDILYKKINSANRPRIRSLTFFAKKAAILLRKIGLPQVVGAMKKNPLVQNILFVKDEEIQVQVQFPRSMIENYNRELDALADLLDIDFETWKRPLIAAQNAPAKVFEQHAIS
ncbi:MAG: sulfotransferase domain-containing protein [candidate division KSB1 bacterium]|nr:sulfotransferase domain-containing protein [candidate division KSB1 bacterium]